MTKSNKLKAFFYALQEEMNVKLSHNRLNLTHPGTKGAASELNWIEWLRTYLPKRYSVDNAFVIDSNDKCSDQIDLVIYDQQYSPFAFKQDGAIYIPAESVYAIFEVKQELSKANLEYAQEKIKSVRLLNRTSIPIRHAGGEFKPRKPFTIIGGILTLGTSWSDAFGEPFKECIYKSDDNERIDLGCVLQAGSFEINYGAATDIKLTTTPDEALIFFFLKLLSQLQRLGTVTALDIEAYARALESI